MSVIHSSHLLVQLDFLYFSVCIWYHCLPIGIYHWLGKGGCIAAVCEVVCYTEVRPGLSGKKMWWHLVSKDENDQMDV